MHPRPHTPRNGVDADRRVCLLHGRLQTWMSVDIVASFPLEWFFGFPQATVDRTNGTVAGGEATGELLPILKAVKMVKMLKLLRVGRLFRYFGQFEYVASAYPPCT